MPTTICIVEDRPDCRMGTSYLLTCSPGFTVLGEFATAEALFDSLRKAVPDELLMDISLPGMPQRESHTRTNEATRA